VPRVSDKLVKAFSSLSLSLPLPLAFTTLLLKVGGNEVGEGGPSGRDILGNKMGNEIVVSKRNTAKSAKDICGICIAARVGGGFSKGVKKVYGIPTIIENKKKVAYFLKSTSLAIISSFANFAIPHCLFGCAIPQGQRIKYDLFASGRAVYYDNKHGFV